MGTGATLILLFSLLALETITTYSQQQPKFKCTEGTTCRSLVGFPSPNATTLRQVQKFLGVKNLRSMLGANDLPLSTPPDSSVGESEVIIVPIPCICFNGTGVSNRMPVYTVQPDDGLYHIANDVFMGLLEYEKIQAVNKIEDADLIDVGQRLWIPLPCSCEDVDGERVVHYAHVVVEGSTVEGIAEEFGTTDTTLYKLNGIANNSQLIAYEAIDVPLKGRLPDP